MMEMEIVVVKGWGNNYKQVQTAANRGECTPYVVCESLLGRSWCPCLKCSSSCGVGDGELEPSLSLTPSSTLPLRLLLRVVDDSRRHDFGLPCECGWGGRGLGEGLALDIGQIGGEGGRAVAEVVVADAAEGELYRALGGAHRQVLGEVVALERNKGISGVSLAFKTGRSSF